MLEPELLELLESTVLLAAPQGTRTVDGQTAYAANVGYRAHVEPTSKRLLTEAGETIAATGRVLLDDAYPTLTQQHRLTLPSGQQPVLLSVETTYDPSGPYQTVLYF